MKIIVSILALLTFVIGSPATSAPATSTKSFVIEAQFEIQNENSELDAVQIAKDGWVVHDDAGDISYKISLTIPESKLPYRIKLGDAYLSIGKTGQIAMGISVGDADASAETRLQWPVEKKKLSILPAPLVLEVNGGDHASGVWGINAKASFQVIK